MLQGRVITFDLLVAKKTLVSCIPLNILVKFAHFKSAFHLVKYIFSGISRHCLGVFAEEGTLGKIDGAHYLYTNSSSSCWM